MKKLFKSIKKLFTRKKYKLYFAMLETDKTTDLVVACENVENDVINEESIKDYYENKFKNEGYIQKVEHVKTIKTCIVSPKCVFELIEAMQLEIFSM
jgi:predicted hydrolase (HD superfamily)